jgi:hypothetical protein
LLNRAIILTRHIETPFQADVDADRERIELARFVDLSKTIFRPSDCHEVQRESLIGGGVARVLLNRAGEAFGGAGPIPIIVELHRSQRGLRFGQSGIDVERAQRRSFGLRCCLLGKHRSEDLGADDGIAIGEAGVSQGILRRLVSGLFEITDSASEVLVGSLIPVVTPFQIMFVRLRGDRLSFGEPRLVLRCEVNPNLVDNGEADTVLQSEDVTHLALVGIGPKVAIGRDLNHLCGDAYAVTDAKLLCLQPQRPH